MLFKIKIRIIDKINSLFKHILFSPKFKYIILLSPILLSSFFIEISVPFYIPADFLSSSLAIVFAILICIYIVKKQKEISILSVFILITSLVISLFFIIFAKSGIIIPVFGYNISSWTALNIIAIALMSVFIFELKINKIVLILTGVPVLYTIINFLIFLFSSNIWRWTGYINFPMMMSGTIYNYPFLYSVIAFVSAGTSYILYTNNIKPMSLNFSILFKFLFYIFILLYIINLTQHINRYIARYNYISSLKAFDVGDLTKSRELIDKALSLYPYDSYYDFSFSLYYNNILSLLQTVDKAGTNEQDIRNEALDILYKFLLSAEVAIKDNPYSGRNYVNLGYVYKSYGLSTNNQVYLLKSFEAYEKARELYKTDKDIVDIMEASLFFSMGRGEEGLMYLKQAIDYNPFSLEGHLGLIRFYIDKKDFDSALIYAKRAIEIAPDNIKVVQILGLLYIYSNEYDLAIMSLLRALELDANDNISLYRLAWVYKQKGGEEEKLKVVLNELEKRLGANIPELQDLRK